MSFAEVYVDESGSHEGSPFLCVAAYVFYANQAIAFNHEWQAMLEKYEPPFFHMIDCAHGTPPFDRLAKDVRIAAETEAIQIIRHRTERGLGVIIKEGDFLPKYRRILRYENVRLSPYYFCLEWILNGVQLWVENAKVDGQVSYFFESGHADTQCQI